MEPLRSASWLFESAHGVEACALCETHGMGRLGAPESRPCQPHTRVECLLHRLLWRSVISVASDMIRHWQIWVIMENLQ